MPVSDQLKQLVEVHKAVEQAMRGLVKFDQLLQLVAQGHGVFDPSILRLGQLLR